MKTGNREEIEDIIHYYYDCTAYIPSVGADDLKCLAWIYFAESLGFFVEDGYDGFVKNAKEYAINSLETKEKIKLAKDMASELLKEFVKHGEENKVGS